MSRHIDLCDGVLTEGARAPIPDGKLQAFLNAVNNLCVQYDVSIGHEDWGGGFQVVNGYDEKFMLWFMGAWDPNNPPWRKNKSEDRNS